jgi:hypothetical protein
MQKVVNPAQHQPDLARLFLPLGEKAAAALAGCLANLQE